MTNKLIKIEAANGDFFLNPNYVTVVGTRDGIYFNANSYYRFQSITIGHGWNQAYVFEFHHGVIGATTSAATTGGGNPGQLIDTSATFITDGVEVGDYVNINNLNNFVVEAVVSETELTLTMGGQQIGSSGTLYSVAPNNSYELENAIIDSIEKINTTNAADTIITVPKVTSKYGKEIVVTTARVSSFG